MRDEDLPLVRELPLFAAMEEANFRELVQASFLQRFPPQVTLIREGESADFLHVVIEGSVELFAIANGRETTMEIVRPVATFILAAAVNDLPYLMSARTLESARILMLPTRNLHDVFARDAAFARSVVGELSTRYRSTVKTLKNQKLRTGAERLANYLLQLDTENGGTGQMELPIGKRVLAALLGMTPENLSRAFATLAKYGVQVSGPRVTITDRADLAKLARPTPLVDDPTS